jgi:iron complex transport system substrate-binding protein
MIYSNKARAYVVTLTVIVGVLLSMCLLGDNAKAKAITVVDSAGREITLSSTAKRIVSVAPTNTEILYALGLGERVIGVTDFCNYPAEALDKPKVGGFMDLNFERIVELEPDVVLGTIGVQGPLIKNFEEVGINFISIEPSTVDGLLDSIELVGRITGAEEAAKELASSMRVRIDAVREKVKDIPEDERPTVFYETWNEALMIMTIGPGTYIHDIIEIAGGKNIYADAASNWPQIDSESLIARNPDVIISAMWGRQSPQEIKSIETWKEISAVKNDRVYIVSDMDLWSKLGPRIVDAVEEMAGYLHPELFAK